MFRSLIKGYAFDTAHDVFLSVFPGFKYHIAAAMIAISTWVAALALVTGMTKATLWAFIIASVVELLSGIYAGVVVSKAPFESGKLGRWGFKIVILLAGLYILHQFSLQFNGDSMISDAFDWAYNFLFAQGAFEYVISILENYAVITGKDKNYYVSGFKEKLANVFNPNK